MIESFGHYNTLQPTKQRLAPLQRVSHHRSTLISGHVVLADAFRRQCASRGEASEPLGHHVVPIVQECLKRVNHLKNYPEECLTENPLSQSLRHLHMAFLCDGLYSAPL